MRKGYDPSEVPLAIVVGCHTRPNRRGGEYVLLHPTLGHYERQMAGFVKFESRSWGAAWRVEREVTAEKVRDTHKLACLGPPEDKIHLWPCPDPATCKLDRCPERIRVAGVVQV